MYSKTFAWRWPSPSTRVFVVPSAWSYHQSAVIGGPHSMQLRPYRDVTLSRSVFPPILPRFEADVIGLALLPPAREGSAIVIVVADDAQMTGLLMRVSQGSG